MTARKRITRVSPMSAAQVLALLYAIVGLIAAVFLGFANVMGVRGDFNMGVIAIIPVAYGIGGFLGGLMMSALYNVVASTVGGIEIDLADEQPWE